MKVNILQSKINPYTFTFQKNESFKPLSLEKTPAQDSFQMSVGYVNDLHGSTNNMMRILSGIKGDLVLSAGDNDIGDEKNGSVHKAVAMFLNMANIKASALGNHELDTKQRDFVKTLNNLDGDILSVNIEQDSIENQSPEDIKKLDRTDFIKHLKKSKIVEVKGEKIGLVGASPIDMFDRATHPDYHTDCRMNSLDDTIKNIQTEINRLKEQGINKIFLLSHLGNATDKIVAQNTDGIDVIIGGHTHELIRNIEEDKNLFYSKAGEPVVLTEAGKNGNYFGLLNLEFNKEGVVTKVQNNIAETGKFHKNMIVQNIFYSILGKPEVIGTVKQAPPPAESLIEENAHANFMCDAMRYELNADIGLWNNSGTRNFFHAGEIDSSEIKDIAPFADGVSVADVSEKKIVDMFKHSIEATYRTQGNKPGLMAVSGLEYTVNPKKGILTAMSFVDKDGSKHEIDIDNPSDVKTYKVVTDSFMMSCGADFDILCPKGECLELPYNKDFFACEYIKHQNKPIEINQTGRIHFEE